MLQVFKVRVAVFSKGSDGDGAELTEALNFMQDHLCDCFFSCNALVRYRSALGAKFPSKAPALRHPGPHPEIAI